ncbi:MAG TPA: MarR family transcriptional regulator [Baekduia sp.]|nr:MarR family transcriptional regulator [Baekduia sp.]
MADDELPADPFDRAVAEWRRERPDLADPEVMGELARLAAVVDRAKAQLEDVHGGHGLRLGEFDVLASLRRAGPPFRRTPSALARAVLLSPAAMTNRVDRLEARGLVRRRPDPDDRRASLVELTAKGRRIVDRALDDHVAAEHALVARLSGPERRALDRAVRRLAQEWW